MTNICVFPLSFLLLFSGVVWLLLLLQNVNYAILGFTNAPTEEMYLVIAKVRSTCMFVVKQKPSSVKYFL